MSTRARLAALLAVALGICAVGLALLRHSHTREAEAMLDSLREERDGLLTRLVELNGLTLRTFAQDYSFWDELLEFVAKPDPTWAQENLAVSLGTFQAHAVWVLRPDGTAVYAGRRDLDVAWPAPPVPPPELLARLQRDRFLHFFLPSPRGPLEIRAAPIQPSSDSARVTVPAGWLVVGKLWDGVYLDSLRDTVGGTVELHAPAEHAAVTSPPGVHLDRALPGWDGRAVAILHTHYVPPSVELLLEENKSEVILFAVCGLTLLGLMLFGVTRWVIAPLGRLEQGLANRSPAPLSDLRHDPGEFGRLALLVEHSFDHRSALEREIEERQRVEEALRASEASLRESVDLRTRLGRDLHDGVIQSLFAAGLGLEAARDALRSDPDGAARRLEAAQASLNRTIREVRGFITGLEPEGHDRRPFRESLRSLLQTLQALHPARITLELPAGEAGRNLTPPEEVHALQIVREGISNALRHGGAGAIRVVFGPEGGRPRLRIEDDGVGFVPAEIVANSSGSGLANLAARAAEIGAHLRIDSAPGRGTRVVLEFAPAAGS